MEKDLHNDPKLPEGLSKKLPFREPEEGYFDQLPQQIMARLPESAPRGRRSLVGKLQWAVPAMLVVLVAVGYWFLPTGQTTETDLLAGLTEEELVAYLDEALQAEDVLYYELAYTGGTTGFAEDILTESSVMEGDYLDDLSLDDLEELDMDDLDLDLLD